MCDPESNRVEGRTALKLVLSVLGNPFFGADLNEKGGVEKIRPWACCQNMLSIRHNTLIRYRSMCVCEFTMQKHDMCIIMYAFVLPVSCTLQMYSKYKAFVSALGFYF